MRRIFAIAFTDLLQTVKDKPVIFWMVIMPVIFIYAFGAMSGGGDTRGVTISLLVVDEDQSYLSQAFTRSLGEEGFAVRVSESVHPDTVAAFPRALLIPAGFQDSVATGAGVTLRLHRRSGSNEEASVTAEMHLQRAVIGTIAHLAEAQQATAPEAEPDADPFEAFDWRALFETPSSAASNAGGQPESEAVLVIDEAFMAAFEAASADSGRVLVASETAGRGRPVPSGTGQSFPATLTLFMLVNTSIYGAVFLTQEKQDGILPRIATHAISRTGILTGKLLGRTLLALMQAVILLLAGKFLLGVYLGNSLVGLALVILCLALTVGAIALFWGAVLRKVEQATVIALVVSLFMGAIGGCWWPLEVVPAWMRTAGHISPAAWAMDGFHALISYGAGLGAVVVPCLALLGFAAAFTLLGARFLRYEA